jgi:hypothetical protein
MVLILKKLKQYADCKRANKMIDKRFMDDLAADDIIQTPQVNQDTLLASGLVTSDMPQTGVRVGRAGITPEQSAKAGGLERPAIALLDTLAGALRGFTAQVGGLPGDVRSLVDMINKEGAQKYLGNPTFATTDEILKDTSVRIPGTNVDLPFPQVVPSGVANEADRQKTVEFAQQAGTFLPGPGLPEAAVQGVKAVGKAVKATKGLPVGMSTQAVGEGVDELGFYSAAKQAVDAIQQPKGTGDQFLKQIEKTPGVKPDEIKWTGLDEFLKSKKSVTKAEVQEYLAKNRVDVKEVQLGDLKLNEKSEYALPEVLKVLKENQSNGYSGMRLTLANDYDAYQALTKKFPNLEDTDNWEDRVLSEIISPDAGGTKFSKWQLPGGQNYREIFMTLPTKTVTEDEARVILGAAPDAKLSEADIYYASRKNKDDYIVPRAHSAGTNEADINRIAHLRVNDRVVDGKKTLFVEEVQSDWHQAGRKQGYKQPDLTPEDVRAEYIQPNVPEGGNPDIYPGYYEVFNKKTGELVTRAGGGLSPERAIQEAIGIANASKSGVPDAPFKTTWSELAMKRAIQLASEGGYDRIAFTTGKIQNERYNLSSQINEASAIANKDGTYNLVLEDKSGNEVTGFTNSGKRLTPQELEETIGKDLAQKLIEGADARKDKPWPKSASINPAFFSVKGVDLDIGGEGMKGFYDDILPKFLNKYSKKWDSKVGKTQLYTSNVNIENKITFENGKYLVDSGDGINYNTYSTKEDAIKSLGGDNPSVSYIDITPKMKESVMTKGQPMFAIGAGGAGAAATQTEDNK